MTTKNKWLTLFVLILPILLVLSKSTYAQGKIEFTLEECIQNANNPKKHVWKGQQREHPIKAEEHKGEKILRIKTLYYDLLLAKELTKLSNEIKSNFEKAKEKAEEKLESDDPDITQQDVLKLKLGLVGSKDELNHLKHKRKTIIESIKYELGIPNHMEFGIKAKKLTQKKIRLNKIEDYYKMSYSDENILNKKETTFQITKAYLKIKETGESVKIGREARKISRSLLVTNLANFDFGIGDAKDLFESLFIYMKTVKNYLEKIRDYNVAVAELSYKTGKEISSLNN